MRTFEILLILANVSSLFLSFKMSSRRVWIGTAGVNLLLLLVHGLFEGFRYQLAFSYLFVALLAMYALIKISGRFIGKKLPRALKAAIIGLSVVGLAATSYLAHALPVFTLPKPTGSDAVGVRYMELVDERRDDPFLAPPSRKRRLMVKIYYPAQDDSSKRYVPYFNGSTELIQWLTAGYHLPEIAFDQLKLAKTHSKEDLPLSGKQPDYPVILFSHGAGTTMEAQTSQCEDLASNGYVVMAIDHTYLTAATVFPDRTATPVEITAQFQKDVSAQLSQIMADDQEFVLNQLGEMNDGGTDSIFKGKLNLNEIGSIGHSLGGSAAYSLAIRDSRVKAAIDLDGTVYDEPEEGAPMAPFLMLANDLNHVQMIQSGKGYLQKFEEMTDGQQQVILSDYGSKKAYEKDYERANRVSVRLAEILKASGSLYTIKGSDHMKFTDIGLFVGDRFLRKLIGIGGDLDPASNLKITEAVTLSFFDRHLKGETEESIDSLAVKYPELEKVELN
ncbi:alpha/beta hydrolase family protein [Cohnella zeiphila]|uniref:Dienelactone hydrolase family protein n=1 Tax=Cohnella zeiphila TaxID=2761120 RepID=A0A7X0SI34_9BACL|nr:dienelactone hydrolase family protein [Cohnella zeiphila]MBB6730400.1 dienelactone hydrolase family protein [Cohnella zeiphila]